MQNLAQPESQKTVSGSHTASHVKDIALSIFKAYEDKDLKTAENLIADNFTFTSPLDNKINRDSYFKLCWPNSQSIDKFNFQHVVALGNCVFVTYDAVSKTKKFRNTELLTVENNKIVSVEVYFGWNLPHNVPTGEHGDSW